MTQLHPDPAPVADLAPNAIDADADDLTADDHLAVETDKDAPGDPDADLRVPDQDPDAVPVSVVDENGDGR